MTSVSAPHGLPGQGGHRPDPALAGRSPSSLGSLTGAPLGAKVSRRAPIGVLRAVLVVLIALVTIRVWADVLWH